MNSQQSSFHDRGRISKVPGNLVVILLGAWIAGCAPVSPTANEDRALFEKLCNASDRDFINFTAKGKGYAEARSSDSALPCPDASLIPDVFTKMGYQFYECVEGPWAGKDDPTSTTYRFSLEAHGSPLCEMRTDRVTRVNRLLDNWKKTNSGFEDKCIGVNELTLPLSRYIKLGESGRVKLDGTHVVGHQPRWRSIPGYITFSRTQVLDRQTNKVMAESKFYFLLPFGAQYIDMGQEQCDSADTWSITDIIKPEF